MPDKRRFTMGCFIVILPLRCKSKAIGLIVSVIILQTVCYWPRKTVLLFDNHGEKRAFADLAFTEDLTV